MQRPSLYIGGQASGADKCDVIVNSPLVSPKHCCIKRIGSSYYLQALGYNPSWVQGNLVPREQECLLKHGDWISLVTNYLGDESVKCIAAFTFHIMCPSRSMVSVSSQTDGRFRTHGQKREETRQRQ